MGYSTNFKGELKFTRDLTGPELATLKEILGQDCRDHPDWDAKGLYHVDLELLRDFSGIEWDGSEKTYELDKIVNVVIGLMRKTIPDFGLEGKLMAQGEDIDDRWELIVPRGQWAEKKEIKPTGSAVICPHCEGKVYIDEAKAA